MADAHQDVDPNSVSVVRNVPRTRSVLDWPVPVLEKARLQVITHWIGCEAPRSREAQDAFTNRKSDILDVVQSFHLAKMQVPLLFATGLVQLLRRATLSRRCLTRGCHKCN